MGYPSLHHEDRKLTVLFSIGGGSGLRETSLRENILEAGFRPELQDRGQYTAEQLELFRAQRANVLGVISLTERIEANQDTTGQATSQANGDSGPSPSSGANEPASFSPLHPAPALASYPPRGPSPARAAVNGQGMSRQSPPLKCCWTSCSACRPLLFDRAWLSLDAAVRDDLSFPVGISSTDWPPISNRNIVANLGLRPSPLWSAPRVRSTASRQLRRMGRLSLWRSPFSRHIRNENGVPPPAGPSGCPTSTLFAKDSIIVSSANLNKPLPFADEDWDKGNAAAGPSKTVNGDDDLEEIGDGNTSIPGFGIPTEVKDADPKHDPSEPVEVENGVAVTEEAVTQHVADIISGA